MKSLGAMIQQLDGLVDTADLSDWENGFVENVVERTGNGKATSMLTERQVDSVETIYKKHFGDAA